MMMPIRCWMKFLLNTASLIFILAIGIQNVCCMRNFALNKYAYQSSTILFNGFQWTADKAVDGNTNGSNPGNSSTCSATSNSRGNHSWEVDIGFHIIVKTITVYGRTDGVYGSDYQLSGFQVFMGNSSNPWTSDPPLANQTSSNNKHVFASINSVGRFVSVVRWNQMIMTLCEVTVEGECLDGVFSAFCNLTCGKCNEERPCDKDNGTCPTGCDRGWKGTRCDMRIQDTAFTGINTAAIGGIVGTIIAVVVMSISVVIAVVKWKRGKVKTNKMTHLGATVSIHKDEKSETYSNIGYYVSDDKVHYSKANANSALDKISSADYEQLEDTAQNDASVYSMINDTAIESLKKDKVNSSVNYAQQLLSIEKKMNAMEKKKNDLILKKKKLLNKLATSESIAK